ncbi:lipocalin family protein [Hyunsoonleella rubra]|uniref:Lipocalin family protein n=1 Tax=Hyunsoonleella rubra TaxID=1737062 RepID=A0ABW5TF89_9FLAO
MKFMKPLPQIVILALIFVSCNIEPFEGEVPEQTDNSGGPIASNCSEATQNTTEVALTFQGVSISDSNYGEFCNAYKKALENQVALCGDPDGTFQILIDGLGDCIVGDMQVSIVGVWRIVSLTSNGIEELPEELEAAGICYWHEVYTTETITDVDYSGDDCNIEEVGEVLSYNLDANNILSYTTGDGVEVEVEVLELSETTLKLQDSYTELGVNYVDIYTYERQ